MSDFVSSFWSLFVVAIVAGGLVFCLAVLIGASKHRPMADDNSTGHTWDVDLRELNNPLPRWWMGLFLITVIFAIAYLALYPGFGAAEGGLKWTSAGQLQAEQAKAAEAMKAVYAEFNGQAPEALAKNPKAMAIGERLFVNNCAQCHGSDARGSKSFPNLADNDWLGGDGSPAYIEKTIVEGRQGVMPPMAAAVGTPEDVKAVANYVLSLSGGAHNSVAAQVGKPKFAACAACHGPEGKGTQALGAPNLTDKVWLHGWGEAQVVSMINNGKTNVMPAQGSRFTPDQLKVLTAYVWSLSQSTKVAAQ